MVPLMSEILMADIGDAKRLSTRRLLMMKAFSEHGRPHVNEAVSLGIFILFLSTLLIKLNVWVLSYGYCSCFP